MNSVVELPDGSITFSGTLINLKTANYTRVLGFNDRGRMILKAARQTGCFLNAGEIDLSDYGAKERQIGDLYGLFCENAPEAPGAETARRIYYHKEF